MPILRHALSSALLMAVALTVSCGGDDNTSSGPTLASLDPVPHHCRTIAEKFGYTLQGGAGDPFIDIVHAIYTLDDDRSGLEVCSRNTANDVELACNSVACTDNGGFAQCLVIVEQAMLSSPCFDRTCGDGICQLIEAQTTNFDEDTGQWVNACPEDCRCGNLACEPDLGENEITCEVDCEPVCGNGICSWSEVCGDPQTVSTECPFDQCDPLPDIRQRCDEDCCGLARSLSICGDGICSTEASFGLQGGGGETGETCEADCGDGRCGDGLCLPPETFGSCEDCNGICTAEASVLPLSCGGGANCLSCPQGCRDPDEHCGDGVCSGCEVWTCRIDCADADFALCTTDEGDNPVCPDRYCGDGQCDGGAENPRTCPLDCEPIEMPTTAGACDSDGQCSEAERLMRCPDCIGAPTVCGDGYCEPGEWGSGRLDPQAWVQCDEDCDGVAACPADPNHPECTTRGSRCVRVPSSGPVTGTALTQWAAFDCESCQLTLCGDSCSTEGGAAHCVECSPLGPEGGSGSYQRCGDDSAPFCLDETTLSTCTSDPGAPSQRACDLRTTVHCPAGCADGACLPCSGTETCLAIDQACDPTSGQCRSACGDGICGDGELCLADCAHLSSCGDGLCMNFETLETCPQDCTCGETCNVFIYDQEAEFRCPSGYAACFCDNGRCEDWEQEGEWACAADCP